MEPKCESIVGITKRREKMASSQDSDSGKSSKESETRCNRSEKSRGKIEKKRRMEWTFENGGNGCSNSSKCMDSKSEPTRGNERTKRTVGTTVQRSRSKNGNEMDGESSKIGRSVHAVRKKKSGKRSGVK
jgi:hypothetical protein